jgi:hypothetical protein
MRGKPGGRFILIIYLFIVSQNNVFSSYSVFVCPCPALSGAAASMRVEQQYGGELSGAIPLPAVQEPDAVRRMLGAG